MDWNLILNKDGGPSWAGNNVDAALLAFREDEALSGANVSGAGGPKFEYSLSAASSSAAASGLTSGEYENKGCLDERAKVPGPGEPKFEYSQGTASSSTPAAVLTSGENHMPTTLPTTSFLAFFRLPGMSSVISGLLRTCKTLGKLIWPG